MSSEEQLRILDRVGSTRCIDTDDIRNILREFLPDGLQSRDDGEFLFQINRAAHRPNDQWQLVLSQLLIDFVGRETGIGKTIGAELANWLIAGLSDTGNGNGRLRVYGELDALLRMAEMANACAPALCEFTLKQAAIAVIGGYGAARRNRPGLVGVVGPDDLNMMRRVLLAVEGTAPMAFTRPEIEVLFDINDGSEGQNNHAGWSDLFVRCIVGYVAAGSGYPVPARHDALAGLVCERDGFDEDMADDLIRAIDQELFFRTLPSDNACFVAVATDETRWLAERIGRNGPINKNERRVLTMLRRRDLELPASLQTLVDTAA